MKKIKKFRKALLALIVLGGIAFAVYSFAFKETEEALSYKTADFKQRDILFAIDATGTLEPEDLVDVGARVSGEIVAFGKDLNGKTIDYASRVKKDDIIAYIDDEIPQSDLKEAQARLEASNASKVKAQASLLVSEAAMRQALRDWERAQKLGVSDALSQAAYDSYLSAYEQTKAQVESAKAQIVQADAEIVQSKASVTSAQRNLGYCIIRAPVDGVIIDRKVNIGQTVVSNMSASSLFLIAKDLSRMEIWASVNEADIGHIKVGQKVTFTVDAFPSDTFTGTVGKIRLNATMTQNVVTYIVEVVTDNSEGKLIPYLTANLKFEIAKSDNAWSVPLSALEFRPTEEMIAPNIEIPEGKKVWIAGDDNFLRPIKIQTGLSDNIMYTEALGKNLKEMKVVTGVNTSAAPTARASGSNPFTPAPPRRGNAQRQQQQQRQQQARQ